MFARRIYYQVKPIIPWSLRIALRRLRARRILKACECVWPIKKGTETPPQGWPGWPEGKKFGLVLTHDVEGQSGVNRCRDLMHLEMELGFRSSFNFIPEGGYDTPQDLRDELAGNGFEIGVHDLRHDGKLFQSYKTFKAHAARINHYLKKWNAVGFRAGFMLRNLDWIGQLDILYDSSTFDTDPFEPQPESADTIFPYWVPSGNGGPGFVELPYTLSQDFTLFVLFRQRNSENWKRKLDWVAQNGGMALVNVHPDYTSFHHSDRAGRAEAGSARYYRELLEYLNQKYRGQFWHALPKEVATYVRRVRDQHSAPSTLSLTSTKPTSQIKIWIDLDNTPHVPFFIPIARELRKRGYTVVKTARDAFQVSELADRKGLQYFKIGRHYGKNPLMKVLGLVWRAAQLAPFCRQQKPKLALSHGARSQIFLANLLRIPTVQITDYEHAKAPPMVRPRWEIVPDSLSGGMSHSKPERSRDYRGIKEDVYAPEFKPDPSMLVELGQIGLRPESILVTVRPPATEAHYHNPESELLLTALMERICTTPNVQAVLLPRNRNQEQELRAQYPHWFAEEKTIVPIHALDGLNLLWYSDLIVSGGGTMNREGAALSVPVYSIFRGKLGEVDRKLEQEGRLTMIRSVEEVNAKIIIARRDKSKLPDNQPRQALEDIVDRIEEIIYAEHLGGR